MNQSPRLDAAERAELARLLPPPGNPVLSADRHDLLKDAFLHQITETRAPRSPRRFALLAVPVAAAVLVAAVVGAAVLGRTGNGGATSFTSPVVTVAAGDAAGVAPLMERVALVAGQESPMPVGADEYVYIRSKVAWLVFPGDSGSGPQEAGVDARVLDQVHDRELWVPASQGSEGLIRERGETFGLTGAVPNSRYAGLPSDPDELLERVHADTKGRGGGPDAAAFDFLGEALRESLLPPPVAAAIYRAAAKIPGVVLVADSVDAEGRHGVAVARTDQFGERQEWIFDARTLAYLGERSYLVRDTGDGKAGMLTATTAVLARGVVRAAGDLPG
ncbi:hypothetical protein GCM10020358_12020 [Amorphoplanes nipponensis]|uniref:CU044_5270 family protein n=1 Tax=Actinoplanes nipponensis TaxID=135950 RepID=A0A919JPR4_9ACTN|nr:CU044_5270 family protein [Actinoplanes nipponensis]GIE53085.1 hypothetical protein Ani05nite_66190 [Actinoplanes nipponensis]